METILNVKGLTKSFGPKKAVDGISLSVTRGEVMGLLGPNGAGKTTAIRMIMGIPTTTTIPMVTTIIIMTDRIS